ncbi:MAG: hypothetical protein AABW48_06480 [Nanoarchaeota archaeon]
MNRDLLILEALSKKQYERFIAANDFAAYKRILAVMLDTSKKINQDFAAMKAACNYMIKLFSKPSYVRDNLSPDVKAEIIKRVNKIISKIDYAKENSLVYAENLPLSISSGWAPAGSISNIRKLINLPGYLLTGLALSKEEQKAAYNQSLADLQNLDKIIEGIFFKNGSPIMTPEAKKEFKNFTDGLRTFLKNTKTVRRTWNRAYKDCFKELVALGSANQNIIPKDIINKAYAETN